MNTLQELALAQFALSTTVKAGRKLGIATTKVYDQLQDGTLNVKFVDGRYILNDLKCGTQHTHFFRELMLVADGTITPLELSNWSSNERMSYLQLKHGGGVVHTQAPTDLASNFKTVESFKASTFVVAIDLMSQQRQVLLLDYLLKSNDKTIESIMLDSISLERREAIVVKAEKIRLEEEALRLEEEERLRLEELERLRLEAQQAQDLLKFAELSKANFTDIIRDDTGIITANILIIHLAQVAILAQYSYIMLSTVPLDNLTFQISFKDSIAQ